MRLPKGRQEVIDLLVDSKYLEPSAPVAEIAEVNWVHVYAVMGSQLLYRVDSIYCTDTLYLTHSNLNPLNRGVRLTKSLDERSIGWGTEINWMWQE
jgi:hypothetical protein